jgi:uncharacterized protein
LPFRQNGATRLGADAHGRAVLGVLGLGGPWRGTSLALALAHGVTTTPSMASCYDQRMSEKFVEIRSFKWPQRPTSIITIDFLIEDSYGTWLGAGVGTPWRSADGTRSGVMDTPLVKLVPANTFWSVCFHPSDPHIDVDIILPVKWEDGRLEEVDLELDVMGYRDGRVVVRDRDKFEQVKSEWPMPDDIVMAVEATCADIVVRIEQNEEPFATVGMSRLEEFLRRRA